MPYTVTEIGEIIQAERSGTLHPDRIISHLLTDSRQIRFAGHSLFFAIRGPHHDGHGFLKEAYQKGVKCFVVRQIPRDWVAEDALFLRVHQPLDALQQLCRHHRSRFHIPIIGITGSNGKTTVKEWLFQILQDTYHIVRSPRSYNSQVGVPLSIWAIRPTHELGIFEAGISQTGEMEKLAAILHPTIGILTNIGSAHDAGFQDRLEKTREKVRLFSRADVLIYESGRKEIDRVIAESGLRTFSWSFHKKADLSIISVERQSGSTQIQAHYNEQQLRIEIPFSDDAAIQNAIHCWATGLYLGLPAEYLAQRLAQLTPIAMRLELQAGRNGCTLINDSYNSDIQSLSIALSYAQQQRGDSRLTLILSDILQSGMPAEILYEEVADLLHQFRVDRLIGVGENIPLIGTFLRGDIDRHFLPDTPELLDSLDTFDFRQETILIKGARPFAFETIALRLLPHTHRTLLEINLSAIAHNIRAFNALLGPDIRMMGMVKAAAYGSGSAEVARLLSFQGIQYLGVAYVDEGVELRRAGIHLPIMVLNPEPVTFSALAEYKLEPEVYSLAQVRALAQFTRARSTTIPIHIKVDTGMRRLGFMEGDLPELTDLLRENPQLPLASVFSHLAASEDPAEDAFTRAQFAAYSRFYDQLAGALTYRPLRHLLNSAGIARFPQYQMDMVRLGIGMYGVEVCRELEGQLRPAFRLSSRISQIRPVLAGESIGYGRRGRSDQDRRIATVSIGYADGLLRKAGNGQYAFRLHQLPAPTVGNICMDMCMIDVTHIPEAREGDEVLIFGEEQPIEKLAEIYGTIPYEVLTGISSRVKRVYIME